MIPNELRETRQELTAMNHQLVFRYMRIILPFFLMLSFMTSLALPVNAADVSPVEAMVVTMYVNVSTASINQESFELEQPPVISNGRTLVPLRFFSEAMGARITWNAKEQSILFQDEARQVLLFVNQHKAVVNDQHIRVDVPPVIANGRTLVPVRLISEVLGYGVEWNDQSKAVTVTGTAKAASKKASVQSEQSEAETGVKEIVSGDQKIHGQEPAGELSFQLEVIRLVNIEREKEGMKPLSACDHLMQVAEIKSMDMVENSYFSHTSPVYGGLRDLLTHYQVIYSTSGENIAAGQRTPEEVMKGWMNSTGHRSNILHPGFTRMGVGTVEGGVYSGFTWTQLFAD
jgi:uncharacterized YkwD family protein